MTDGRSGADLASMIELRISGVPLEHVLGWAEFCGQRFAVDPGVFVPRRRTEFLVSQAAALTPAAAVVVDLCCGSGAIGAALAGIVNAGMANAGMANAVHDTRVELYSADIEAAAVACALRNVAAVGGRVHQGDLYDALPAGLRGRVDVMVVNAPYVPTGSIHLMPPEARLHEPLVTLDGGPDGLAVQRRVAAEARQWLAPGGHLLMETSDAQASHTVAIFERCHLSTTVAHSEDLDATVVVGHNA